MPGLSDKNLVLKFFAAILNRQDQRAAFDIVTADFVAHHPQFPPVRGPDGLNQMVAGLHAAFPDLRYEVIVLVGEGSLVAARWSASGTHRGQLGTIAATQKPFAISGMDLFRIAEGRVGEAWINSDFLGLLQQLGLVPPLFDAN